MPTSLSDKELVKAVRGRRTKSEFARMLGVTRPLIPAYERGAAKPSGDVWVKMARLAAGKLKLLCWERAGFGPADINDLLHALRIENEPRSQDDRDRLKAKEAFSHSYPKPVTEVLLANPTPEEDKAKTLDVLVKRYGPLEEVDYQGARDRVYELLDEIARDYGIPPAKREALARMYGLPFPKPVGGEAKPPTAAKKAKRERRHKR